jgi:hypothetical protein
MPEADILQTLRLIDERINSPKIDVRHRDTLIRLRDILEHDLKAHRSDTSSEEQLMDQETAA